MICAIRRVILCRLCRFLNFRLRRQVEDRAAVVREVHFMLACCDVDTVREKEIRADEHFSIDAEAAAKPQLGALHFLVAKLEARKSTDVALMAPVPIPPTRPA